MIKRLYEDDNSSSDDIYIYVDDTTGDYYYFDGESLIKIGSNKSPEIGKRGSESIKDEEEKERQKQIEKEKNDGEEDPEGEEGEETEEERQARLKRIEDTFSGKDDSIANKIDNETTSKVYKDQRKKADLARAKQKEIANSGLAGFKLSLKKFIANELLPQKGQSWSKINKKYARSSIIKPGISRRVSSKVPSINVYFDQSASWGESDIQVGLQAIASLNEYVKEGLVKIFVYRFADEIDTYPGSGYVGGGTNTANVLQHIKDTRPDNVIIMSDADGEGQGNPEKYKQIGKVTIPGSVWFLWKRGLMSPSFRSFVVGRKENKQFSI